MGVNVRDGVVCAALIAVALLFVSAKVFGADPQFAHQAYRFDAPAAPYVSSPNKAVCTVNAPFAYEITATNSPTKYNAVGLPPGLTVDSTTGWITGVVRSTGTSHATIIARNDGGFGKEPFKITILPPVPEGPYDGSLWAIPGTINVENYDVGGEGIAFHDSDASNQGGSSIRNEGVDLSSRAPNPGYFLDYIVQGEWINYSIFVTDDGSYKISFQMATGAFHNQKVHFEIDGRDVTGAIALPDTGGWDNYQTVTSPAFPMTAGKHVLKFCMDSSDYNAYQIVMDKIQTDAPPPTPAAAPSETGVPMRRGHRQF